MTDVRWLSYDEMAAELGIARESARQLAIRKRWQRQKGNDGRARIGVPEEEFTARTSDDTGPATASSPSPDPSADDTAPITVLTRHIERLERELSDMRERVTDRDSIASQLEALRAVLEVERRHGEELRADRDRLLSAITDRSREGLFTRLRQVFG
jgi:hypothetical protein